MNAALLNRALSAMYSEAKATKDDVRSVTLMRVAERLAHVGAVCEKPLTRAEEEVAIPFLVAAMDTPR